MSAYHKKLEKPLSKEGSRVIICCKNNYLEEVTLQRYTPPSSKKASQLCHKHSCDITFKHHDCSNKKHIPSRYNYNAERCTKGSMPPPESVSAIVKKNYKSAMPCDLYEGALVQVYSERENLAQHNGRIGTVAGVIYSRDRNRSIIYVEIPGITPQPTFWYSELKAVAAPQATKEGVQICQ